MNTQQRENVRPLGDATTTTMKGENVHPTTTTSGGLKPLGLSSLRKTSLNSQLKPLNDSLSLSRKILSDKSNKGLFKPSTTLKQHYSSSTTISESKTRVFVDEKSTLVEKTTIKSEDTLQQSEQLKIKQDFIQDNKERYIEIEEEEIAIVPILPIVVPKNLRRFYEKDTMNYKVGSKRPPYDNKSQQLHHGVDKRQRSSLNERLFVANAPPLKFEVNEETRILERQQETKAKLAMLQTTQSLKEHQWNDPMLVAEYAGEIFGYLYDSEPKLMGDPYYAMNLQHEVTWRMRSVLVDWVIEIHYLFQLLPETLFLAVNIIDRFLSLRTVVLGKLQLVGITALFIAAKFEEMSVPTMQDFLFMTDNAVRDDELIKAERFILQVLDFHLCYPNPTNFLRRVCTDELKCDIHTRTLAKYFMEIACVDHHFINTRPSKVAAASLWLSRKMLAKGKWTSTFTKVAGYSPDELRPTVEQMLDYLAQPVTHDAFFKKWSSSRLSKASIFVRDWINRYYIN